MSEVNKNAANEQEETEKDIPETETVNEPTEESPEATAGQDAQAEETAQADDDKETKSKTSFFGKKKKDNKLEQQVEELTDRLKRSMAEFDNFRKRTEKEKSSMYVIGAKDIIEKMLSKEVLHRLRKVIRLQMACRRSTNSLSLRWKAWE